MPVFEMNKEGTVNGQEFEDLSPFLQGYIECMLFTNCCTAISMVEWEEPENQESVREGQADGCIPTDAGFGDIEPDTLIQMHADCSDFQSVNRHLLSRAYARGYDEVQAGRDFWYTRCGHGVGYWDREVLEADGLGEALSEAASAAGERWADFYPTEDSATGYGYVYLT